MEYKNEIKTDVRKWLSILAIVSLAAIFSGWISYNFNPGFMSFDSLAQYRQVLGISPLNDAHPVIMVYLWRGLLKAFDYPGVMLSFHQLLYWFSITLFVFLVTRRPYSRMMLLILIGFCPPLVITSLHVWKDVGMMSALALASSALLGYIHRPHWGWILVTLLSLFYAVAVRINGFIPAIFVLVLLCYLVISKYDLPKWKTVALTTFVALVVSLGHLFIMGIVNIDAKRSYGIGTLIVWDMVAISIAEKKDLLPTYLPRIESTNILHDLEQANNTEANYPSYAVVSPYPAETHQKQLIKDWLSLVMAHPAQYLHHRAHVFAVLLGAKDRVIYYPYHPGIDENNLGLRFTSISNEELISYFHIFNKLSESIFYRPWLYFLLAIIVTLISGLRLVRKIGLKPHNLLAATIALSGLATAISLFFLATAADYRYMTWTIFSALIATAILGADIWRSKSSS